MTSEICLDNFLPFQNIKKAILHEHKNNYTCIYLYVKYIRESEKFSIKFKFLAMYGVKISSTYGQCH